LNSYLKANPKTFKLREGFINVSKKFHNMKVISVAGT